jgi:hypothetical protein
MVSVVLDNLAAGLTPDEILTDKTSKFSFPYVDGKREKWYNNLEVPPRP